MERLVELSLNQLIVLLDKFKEKLPESDLTCGTLNNFINWYKKDTNIRNYQVYSLNGDLSDGTFVAIHHSYICGDTLNNDRSRLALALSLLPLDPKCHYRYFYKKTIQSAIWEFVERRDLTTGFEWEFLWYYITPKEGSQIVVPELPGGFHAKPLSKIDIEQVNNYWNFNYPRSEVRIKDLIKYNANIGLYTESGELVAWMLRYETGGLAILEVKQQFRNRGLAKYIVKLVSKELTDLGECVYTTIKEDNDASLRLFKSAGYKPNGSVLYIEILPTESFNDGLISNGYSIK